MERDAGGERARDRHQRWGVPGGQAGARRPPGPGRRRLLPTRPPLCTVAGLSGAEPGREQDGQPGTPPPPPPRQRSGREQERSGASWGRSAGSGPRSRGREQVRALKPAPCPLPSPPPPPASPDATPAQTTSAARDEPEAGLVASRDARGLGPGRAADWRAALGGGALRQLADSWREGPRLAKEGTRAPGPHWQLRSV